MLSAEIINTLGASGLARVVSCGGDYTLQVKLLGGQDEKIGFRVDPQKVDGQVRRNLLASEGRKTMRIEAALYSGGEIAFGPYLIEANADYDYVDGDSIQDLTFVSPAGGTVTVLPFSLGQLEAIDSAQLAVRGPLYRRLALKITEQIGAEW